MNTKRHILFFDCGDTIIDEATQIRNEEGVVIHAKAFDGAAETVRALYSRGYRLCLVADGLFADFKNLMTQHGIYHCFESYVISECIGWQKPSERMFRAAMGAMKLRYEDARNVIMTGNNLKKDIAGAKRLGIRTVWLNLSGRYMQAPMSSGEIPDYVIRRPMEILPILEHMEHIYD